MIIHNNLTCRLCSMLLIATNQQEQSLQDKCRLGINYNKTPARIPKTRNTAHAGIGRGRAEEVLPHKLTPYQTLLGM
uniref:Uncharacterized protein n=1 Tax=Rhizophora mucronata TaxID=61149 RepID=A0A2P2IQV6_RHIMU